MISIFICAILWEVTFSSLTVFSARVEVAEMIVPEKILLDF